eukprot:CAMPEP_0202003762 /NCGR_PEP_ID=MMETSP0905-20130828/9262_1 /ASSEMBLY_ACC=CAM_ASM_000554 /TAXON_ID=420261 /ORGANISM="Thalassiosira antarctica, Strain CCMP982" /LENGTH=155 /DNA_ID=CAMNT_0048560971 /DNA_START=111 /DNA_END=575 /DNA_ORIENTATION=+
MGKKRSNRSTSSSSSKSNNGNGNVSSNNYTANATPVSSSSSNMPSNFLGSGNAPRINSVYTHPMGVPLNTATNFNNSGSSGTPNINTHSNNNHPTSHSSQPAQSNPNNYPFTPAMIRELLSSCPPSSSYSAAMTPGYNRMIPPATTAADLNRLTN